MAIVGFHPRDIPIGRIIRPTRRESIILHVLEVVTVRQRGERHTFSAEPNFLPIAVEVVATNGSQADPIAVGGFQILEGVGIGHCSLNIHIIGLVSALVLHLPLLSVVDRPTDSGRSGCDVAHLQVGGLVTILRYNIGDNVGEGSLGKERYTPTMDIKPTGFPVTDG